MRLRGFHSWGLIPFPGQIDIDLEAIDAQLIAICGPNGAGKTTFLECLMGAAIYRKTRTRGPLSAFVTERTSYVESSVVNGEPYVIRQTYDPIGKLGKSIVKNDNGEAITKADGSLAIPNCGVSEYDAWRAEHLPDPDVIYASFFRDQRSRGFLGMEETERQSLILKVVGTAAMEKKAEKARQRRNAVKKELEILCALIGAEEKRGLTVAGADERLRTALVAKATAAEASTVAKAALETAMAEAAVLRAHQAEADKRALRLAALVADRDAKTLEIAELDRRIAACEETLRDKAAIDDAVEKLAALEARGEELHAAQVKESQRRQAIGAELAALREAYGVLQRQQQGAAERIRRAEDRLKDKAAVEEARRMLPELAEAVAGAEASELEAQAAVDEWRGAALGVAEKRHGVCRSALEDIAHEQSVDASKAACAGDHAINVACDAIAADDDIEKRATEAPERLRLVEGKLRLGRDATRAARERLRKAEIIAQRAEEMASAAIDLETANSERAQAIAAMEATHQKAIALQAGETAARERVDALGSDLLDVGIESGMFAELAKRAPDLASAEARLSELRPRRAALADAIAKLTGPIAELRSEPVDPVDPDIIVDMAKEHAEEAAAAATHAASMVAVAEAHLAQAKDSALKIAAWQAQRPALEERLADWEIWAFTLGKDGMQALEVDSAGPELTEITNDLLHSSFGSRWTVTIETTKLDSTGKRQLECCEVRVFDEVEGREKNGEYLSEGQAVFVGEAISLAIAVLVCRRYEIEGATLVRDESGHALDKEGKATQYVKMLRRAAEMIGIRQILFVTHDPELQALADARIDVRDGQIRVAA